jgi:hypothetical protein
MQRDRLTAGGKQRDQGINGLQDSGLQTAAPDLPGMSEEKMNVVLDSMLSTQGNVSVIHRVGTIPATIRRSEIDEPDISSFEIANISDSHSVNRRSTGKILTQSASEANWCQTICSS